MISRKYFQNMFNSWKEGPFILTYKKKGRSFYFTYEKRKVLLFSHSLSNSVFMVAIYWNSLPLLYKKISRDGIFVWNDKFIDWSKVQATVPFFAICLPSKYYVIQQHQAFLCLIFLSFSFGKSTWNSLRTVLVLELRWTRCVWSFFLKESIH